jgi:hypothetical protein
MRLFFDTSAFIKRYIDEPGSDQVVSLCSTADDIAVSILLPVELIATISRLKREAALSASHYDAIKTALFDDLHDVTVILSSLSVVHRAIRSIETSQIKSLDAFHVGCALEYEPDFFISSDKQQLIAAAKLGLKIKRI